MTNKWASAPDDFVFAPLTASDTCPAGESKSVFLKMIGTSYMNGGSCITDGNAVFGDYISVSIVDHENLYGYGVDFVLAVYIEKWMHNWKACYDFIETRYAGIPPANMYVRLTFYSTGANPVGFAINLLAHNAI